MLLQAESDRIKAEVSKHTEKVETESSQRQALKDDADDGLLVSVEIFLITCSSVCKWSVRKVTRQEREIQRREGSNSRKASGQRRR